MHDPPRSPTPHEQPPPAPPVPPAAPSAPPAGPPPVGPSAVPRPGGGARWGEPGYQAPPDPDRQSRLAVAWIVGILGALGLAVAALGGFAILYAMGQRPPAPVVGAPLPTSAPQPTAPPSTPGEDPTSTTSGAGAEPPPSGDGPGAGTPAPGSQWRWHAAAQHHRCRPRGRGGPDHPVRRPAAAANTGALHPRRPAVADRGHQPDRVARPRDGGVDHRQDRLAVAVIRSAGHPDLEGGRP